MPIPVKELLARDDPGNRLDNFPNYETAFQNRSKLGVPHMFYYSPEQIDLIADMWCYNVIEEAGDLLRSLKAQYSNA